MKFLLNRGQASNAAGGGGASIHSVSGAKKKKNPKPPPTLKNMRISLMGPGDTIAGEDTQESSKDSEARKAQ